MSKMEEISVEFEWKKYCPKEMVRELTRPSKNVLDSLSPEEWGKLGPIIDMIDYYIKEGKSEWKYYMKYSSTISVTDQFLAKEAITRFDKIIRFFREILYRLITPLILLFEEAGILDVFLNHTELLSIFLSNIQPIWVRLIGKNLDYVEMCLLIFGESWKWNFRYYLKTANQRYI